MSEVIRTTEGMTANKDGVQRPTDQETIMGSAFKELAQKLKGGEGVVDTNNVGGVLRDRGIIGESKTANIMSFPFEKTGEAQEELGKEVGLLVKEIIENHPQNIAPVSENGDTISHMTTEKPPFHSEKTENNDISRITYGSPNDPGSSENMPPISYKDIAGATIPTREGVEIKQEANVSPQKTTVLNTNETEKPATEKQLPQKELVRIELERATLVKELRENGTLTAEKQAALDKLTGQMKILRGEISSTPKETGATPNISELVRVDSTVPGNHQITAEAAAILQIIDEGGLPAFNHLDIERICRENGIELFVNHTPADIINKLKAKRSDVSLEPEEKTPQKVMEQVATGRDKNIENTVPQKTEGSSGQQHTEDFSKVSVYEKIRNEIDELKHKKEGVLKDIRDHTVTVIGGHVTKAQEIDRQVEELENRLRDPKLTQQEIDAQDTATPDFAAHVKATREIAPNPFEKAIAKIKLEDPTRAERLLKTIGVTPEQKERIEKLLGATEVLAENTEVIEKESDRLEWARRFAKKYQEIPISIRVGVGLALLGGSIATGGVGFLGSTFALALVVRRGAAGIGTFAAVEGLGRKWVDNSKLWENNKEMGRKFAAVGGVIAGILAGGGAKTVMESYESLTGVIAKGFHEDSVKTLREYYESFHAETPSIPVPPQEIPAPPLHETVESSAQNEYTQKVAAVREILKNEATQTTSLVETSYMVHGNDNLWNIIKEKIPEIQTLDSDGGQLGEGRQSNAIANIIEQIKKDPESFGISSGNVDSLSAGDTIHLDKIHDILKTTTISTEDGQRVGIIERASGLTDTATTHIMENNARISAWHTTHPDILLTTETVDKILKGTMDSGAQTDTFAKDFILNMPNTGGRTIEQLSAEALSLDTDAILHADVQTMFGSKGLFGYGFLGTSGEKSVDWVNLKDHTVNEILSKKFVGMPMGEEGGVQKFGVDSFGAVDKMKGYIKMLIEKAGPGTSPEPTESVEHFSKRAISVIISRK